MLDAIIEIVAEIVSEILSAAADHFVEKAVKLKAARNRTKEKGAGGRRLSQSPKSAKKRRPTKDPDAPKRQRKVKYITLQMPEDD